MQQSYARYPELPFPRDLPPGYLLEEDEIRFDPSSHLALEPPANIITLEDLGYDHAARARCASPVAITSPFRLLSDEGVEAMRRVVIRLRARRSTISGNRTPSHLAGGVYRSAFLRDFCACPAVLEHLSAIAGTTLAPHSLPSQQMYVNYSPEDISKAVDSWHYDGIGFDYVIMLSDPAALRGGRFEYFLGTREEIAALVGISVPQLRKGVIQELPADRVLAADFPAAGYAVFQQGNMVVHRAARLEAPGDRITVVPGLVSVDRDVPDPTAVGEVVSYNEPGIHAELGRHAAWMARNRLGRLLDELPMDADAGHAAGMLRDAVAELLETADRLDDLPQVAGGGG